MAGLSAVYGGPAVQKYINQLVIGNGALIEAELEKAQKDVEYCKGEGAKMSAMQAEIAKHVIDGQARMGKTVDNADKTGDGI